MGRMRWLLWGGVVVLNVSIALSWSMMLPGGPTGVRVVGDAERMQGLASFLEPDRGGESIRGERGAGPVRDPFMGPDIAEPVAEAPGPAQPTLRVSAILISGDRRLAIVGDQVVGVGDVLPGGEQVAEIRRDEVVVQRRDGTRQTVRIDTGGDR